MPTLDSHLPNASSPQLLARLVEMVARGVRTPRALQEVLGVEIRTVQHYTHAGQWLGLLERGDDAWLTPLGLEFAFNEPDRDHIYARAVWETPFVAALLAGRREVPTQTEVAAAIAEVEPTLAPATLQRRAESLIKLLHPAMGDARPQPAPAQLALPLGQTVPTLEPPKLDLSAGRDHDPDVYRYLLVTLLDHGELTMAQLRALLDGAGADQAPIGGYVDLAIARGDATRLDDRLVVSRGAVLHRDLAASTPSVILSDPHYRAWLTDLFQADADRHAQIRRSRVGARFAPWDRRLIGEVAKADTFVQALERVLMDRSLASFPERGDAGAPLGATHAPFLECWRQDDLAITLPPPLLGVRGGHALVNAALERTRQAGERVAAPSLVQRSKVVHGGLLHPGEQLPRALPDLRSLRQRLLDNAPYPSLAAAVLLLHRFDPSAIELTERRGVWMVRVRRKQVGPLLEVLDGFASARGWLPCRRLQGGVGAEGLLGILEATGVASVVARHGVLAESFFSQLRSDPEEMEVYARLEPLAEALSDYLHGLPRSDR